VEPSPGATRAFLDERVALAGVTVKDDVQRIPIGEEAVEGADRVPALAPEREGEPQVLVVDDNQFPRNHTHSG
jgi:hypothetical protein